MKATGNPTETPSWGANAGWVAAGTGHDPAAPAVNRIRFWWTTTGGAAHPGAAGC
ncbi:hypothetical protein G6034_05560 [Arthrobacter sp. AETb3-4]|uniref:Uncharacterized protein n=1 Tax=Arthrobacter wenxiniae TaxID=2713570 RepID=A0A7Y7IGC0_9MICC|nr:hypothetical protein [Arthrobacter wenxiniae]